MSHNNANTDERRHMLAHDDATDDSPTGDIRPTVALIVSSDHRWRSTAGRALAGAGIVPEISASCADADELVTADCGDRIDVAIIDLEIDDGSPLHLVSKVADTGIGAIAAGRSARVRDAIEAMRAGATDLLTGDIDDNELVESVITSARRSRRSRTRERHVTQLTQICQRLNDSRSDVVRQVDTLCTDLVQAYEELTDQMNQVTTAAEFNSLVRQELDIESLLRTTLEFILSRSGPTNAAIFLPTTTGDYSLGAYVNYDCPKDTVDVLLDHLANVVAPRFEPITTLRHIKTPQDFDQFIGDDADWLCDAEVMGFACVHDGEVLAILMLFRDRRTPFLEPLPEQLETVGGLFADQLARVIQVHHRHIPKDKWAAPGDPESDDNADYDDYGGLAA